MSSDDSYSSHNSEHGGVRGTKDTSSFQGEFKPLQVQAATRYDPYLTVFDVATQADDILSDRLTYDVICPFCATKLGEFETNDEFMFDTPIRFEHNYCDTCEEKVHRWEALLARPHEPIDAETTTKFLESWFQTYHHTGPSREASKFRNWELDRRWTHLANEGLVDMEPHCAVCEDETTGTGFLDTHHWNRKTDDVLLICSDCHQSLHNASNVDDGSSNSAADSQDAKAQRLGFRDWRDLAVPRAVRDYTDAVDDDVLEERYERDGSKWRHLAIRLNAFTWRHPTVDGAAEELREVYQAFELLLEDDACLAELMEPNDDYPHW